MTDNILGGATFAKGKEQRGGILQIYLFLMDVMNHTTMTDDLTDHNMK